MGALGAYNADLDATLAAAPFPPDPSMERRRRAADARIVADLGPVRAIEVATSAGAVVRRAAMMLAARDGAGRYLYSAAEVCRALTDWHTPRVCGPSAGASAGVDR